MYQILCKIIKEHEGESLRPYRCPSGKLTIGIGRCLDTNGISKEESAFLFENDVAEVLEDLKFIFEDDFTLYPVNIQIVLSDMRFNLGFGGFRSFKKMISAVKTKNWIWMKREMISSLWFHQVEKRALHLLALVEEVILQEEKQECELSKTVGKLFRKSIEG